ncbi:MAG: hypothetical protein I3274_07830 [Candidatus Moeniiplasma glomeromycotorum]|nr:hypothetical protein [Candidatus Moeniiplasma glomeromycotorum]
MTYKLQKKKKKKNSNLIIAIIAIAILLILGAVVILSRKPESKNQVQDSKSPNQQSNLGQQQREQVREATSQLVGSILDNQNNFNQLTTNPDGSRRNIDDIEEVFLSGGLNQQPQSPNTPAPGQITNSLSPWIVEQSWYELRVFIIACLQNPNQSLLESVRLRVRSDIEKWLKWELEKQKGDYNKLLEEYLRTIQELETIRELFEKYNQIRTNLVINKVDRNKELNTKGYFDIDITQLKDWNLLEQDFPNLHDEKRIGITNALSVIYQGNVKIGVDTKELMLFLKPKYSSETNIHFPPDKVSQSQQQSVSKIIKELLKNSQTLTGISNYDIYILRLNATISYSGPSSGIAHYLVLYSCLHKIPLPRNLGSTGEIKGNKIKAIGGLWDKLKACVEKEKPIDILILSEENKKYEGFPEQSYEDIDSHITEKIKQVHFISQVDQIVKPLYKKYWKNLRKK